MAPLYLAVNKSTSTDKVKTFFSRRQVLESFIYVIEVINLRKILYVLLTTKWNFRFQENTNLEHHLEKHLNWLRSIKLENFPCIIAVGKIFEFQQIYIVFHGTRYLQEVLIIAVQTLYQIIKSLHTTPHLANHVWTFFERLVFQIKSRKPFAPVTKFVSLIYSKHKINFNDIADF